MAGRAPRPVAVGVHDGGGRVPGPASGLGTRCGGASARGGQGRAGQGADILLLPPLPPDGEQRGPRAQPPGARARQMGGVLRVLRAGRAHGARDPRLPAALPYPHPRGAELLGTGPADQRPRHHGRHGADRRGACVLRLVPRSGTGGPARPHGVREPQQPAPAQGVA